MSRTSTGLASLLALTWVTACGPAHAPAKSATPDPDEGGPAVSSIVTVAAGGTLETRSGGARLVLSLIHI